MILKEANPNKLGELRIVQLTKVSEDDLLVGIEPSEEDTYLFYRRKIQVYGPDYKMSAEIILNESLKSQHIAGGQVLLLYEDGSLQMRSLRDWQKVVAMGSPISEATSIKLHDAIITIKTAISITMMRYTESTLETIGTLELPYCEVKCECFSQSRKNETKGQLCMLFRDGSIRNYAIGTQGFEGYAQLATETVSQGRSIVDMFILQFGTAETDEKLEYVLTIDNARRLELYALTSATQQAVLSYGLSGSADLSIQKALYQPCAHRLWLQRDQKGLFCVQFKKDIVLEHPNSRQKFIAQETTVEGIDSELFALASNGLVFRSKGELQIITFGVSLPASSDELRRPKTVQQLLEDKEQIRQEIVKYSRKVAQDRSSELLGRQTLEEGSEEEKEQEYEDIASYLRVFSRLSVMDEFLKHFDTNAYQERVRMQQDNSDLRAQVEGLTSQLQRLIFERNELHERLDELQQLEEQPKQPKIDQETLTVPFEEKKPQLRDAWSNTPETTKAQHAVQTEQQEEPDDLYDVEAQLCNADIQEMISRRLLVMEEKILVETAYKCAQLNAQLVNAKTELLNTLPDRIDRLLTKEVNQCLSETLLTKMEKYFRLTFEKITDSFEQSVKYFDGLSIKETVKLSEISRELVDRNKFIIERIVSVFKQSLQGLNSEGDQVKKSLEDTFETIKGIDQKADRSLNIVTSQSQLIETTLSKVMKNIEDITSSLEQVKAKQEFDQKKSQEQEELYGQSISQQYMTQQGNMGRQQSFVVAPQPQPSYYQHYPQYAGYAQYQQQPVYWQQPVPQQLNMSMPPISNIPNMPSVPNIGNMPPPLQQMYSGISAVQTPQPLGFMPQQPTNSGMDPIMRRIAEHMMRPKQHFKRQENSEEDGQ